MPLVPGYAAGYWLRRWFLDTPLVPGYAAGSWLCRWFLATPLVPGYATGSWLRHWFGGNNFGSFCANQHVVTEVNLTFTVSSRKCPLKGPLATACRHPWIQPHIGGKPHLYLTCRMTVT